MDTKKRFQGSYLGRSRERNSLQREEKEKRLGKLLSDSCTFYCAYLHFIFCICKANKQTVNCIIGFMLTSLDILVFRKMDESDIQEVGIRFS